ncbi:glycosyltransferase [Pyrococcus kukulkanii]|uniref:glycosyltransferase n=1 Tax=Pyrococcus kukulkanii TaxID=1609559 RepID=UPI003569AF94
MRDIKVLVIAPAYNTYIKGFVDALATFVDEVHVLIHHNYLSELSNLIPFGGYLDTVRLYTKKRLIDLKDKPSNVNIHILSTFYFIPDGRNKILGDKLTRKFIEYIERNNIEFDIIHSHFTYPQGYVGIKISERFNVPVIVTLHENHPHLESILRNVKDKAVYTWKNADMLIRVNKKDMDRFVKYGVPFEKIIYIPNGFDPRKFQRIPMGIARKALGIDDHSKIIFNVSRLYPEKGHKYLVEAMHYIISQREDVFCYIGGAGPLYNDLERQIKKLNLQNYIRLLGYVPDQELALWMNAADVFVFPSLNESFGIAVLEALAVGTPVVATYNGGSESILISEDYGLLCEPQNPKDLAEKILIALEKEWNREKILRYATQFTWDNVVRQILQLYYRVMEGTR